MKLKENIAVIFQIFRQDIRRLAHNPIALIVIIGVLFLPSVYAWSTIIANWDPYANTGSLAVAVSNEDQGAQNPMVGTINVGDEVIAKLHDNHEMGWQFVSQDEAMEGVRSGKYYAAIVIPKQFSEDFLSVYDGHFTRPTIDYYVNEKISAVAPKLTDSGASTIQDEINSQFVATVSRTVLEMAQQTGTNIDDDAHNATGSLTNSVRQANDEIANVRQLITDLGPTFNASDSAIKDAQGTIATLQQNVPTLASDLQDSQTQLQSVRSTVQAFGAQLGTAADDAATALGQAASVTQTDIASLTNGVRQSQQEAETALTEAQHILSLNQTAIDGLKPLVESHPSAQAVIDRLQTVNGDLQQTVTSLENLDQRLGDVAQQAATSAQSIVTTAQDAATQLRQASSSLSTSMLPSLSGALDQFADALGTMRGTIVGLDPILSSTQAALTQLSETLSQARSANDAVTNSLDSVSHALNVAQSDLEALNSSASVEELARFLGVSPDGVSDFMAAPVTLKTEVIYPIKNYGTGVAPFFTNLALWVAGFILVAILHLRVDPEGLPKFTVTQAYLGRWLLFMVLGIIQGLIVCVGDLIIGIQCDNPAAFIFAGIFTVIVDVNIMYALVFTMRHIGRAIGVIVLIMQIPGSSGEYPVQMMPPFFQAIHPLLPFTYSIDAMREAIGGMYGNHYWVDLLSLIPFLVLALIFGLAVGRYAFNLNALFDKELSVTDLLVTEQAGDIRERFRFRSIIRALLDTKTYRSRLLARASAFYRHYPILIRIGWALIILLPILMLLMNFAVHADVETKLILLVLMVAGIILIGIYLVVVEYFNYNLAYQLDLSSMSEADLKHVASDRLAYHSFDDSPDTPSEDPAEPSAQDPSEPQAPSVEDGPRPDDGSPSASADDSIADPPDQEYRP